MPYKIELSSDFFNPSSPTVWPTTSNTGFIQRISFGFASSTGQVIPTQTGIFGGSTFTIKIMKGTIPTDFSTLTSTTSRSADVLITFLKSGIGSPILITTDANPITCWTTNQTATASGTATWFWAYSTAGSYLGCQMLGTVGVTGSGMDLEISDTNIISGQDYRVHQLRVNVPTTWNYA